MKFSNIANANGTSFKGTVVTTYSKLVDSFGLPNFGPNDMDRDKVTCEWILKFDDDTIATVYEWKNGFTPLGQHEWHIGGRTSTSVDRVLEVLDSVNI